MRCLPLALAGLLGLAASSGCGANACEDGIDNDGDGVTDSLDPGCAFNGDAETPEPPQCVDGVDNDADGFIDGQDPGCDGDGDDDEKNAPVASCRDGLDNDSDGFIDFPDDPGCSLSVDDDETDQCPDGDQCPACGNGADDDGDGVADYPEDPGCTSRSDDDEFNADPTICGGSVPVGQLPADGIVEGAFLAQGANNLISPDCSGTGGEVAFQFNWPETKSIQVDTNFAETDTDTVVYIRSECRMPDTELGCNDDFGDSTASRLVIEDLPAGDYFLIIDSNGDAQNYKVEVKEYVPPVDPVAECSQELDDVVVVDDVTMNASSAGASNDLAPGCAGDGTSPDRVFQLDVPGTLTSLDIDTSGSSFDTVMAVRKFTCDPPNVTGGCNDDGGDDLSSAVSLSSVAADTYFILVEGFSSSYSGDIVLNVAGVLAADQPCDPAAETAGYITCGNGQTCQGTAGSETCQDP